jgi:hypothetical protein
MWQMPQTATAGHSISLSPEAKRIGQRVGAMKPTQGIDNSAVAGGFGFAAGAANPVIGDSLCAMIARESARRRTLATEVRPSAPPIFGREALIL